MPAEEILNACDESVSTIPSASSEGGLANPAVHFFRKFLFVNLCYSTISKFLFLPGGLKHRNIAAIRHAAMVHEFHLNYLKIITVSIQSSLFHLVLFFSK